MDIKNLIINCFDKNVIEQFELSPLNISTPPNTEMGDFCLPTFIYAKKLGKNPMQIAEMLTQDFNYNTVVESTKVVGGYLNFFLNKKIVSLKILEEILNNPTKISSAKVSLSLYAHLTSIMKDTWVLVQTKNGEKIPLSPCCKKG